MSLPELLRWSGEHAGLVSVLLLIVSGTGLALMAAYRIALAVAVLRAWWRGGSWLGRPSAGGAGGHYSSEYDAFMASPEWRHQRSRVLRRAGGRCQECGSRDRLQVHHLHYATPISATPDWALAVLCRDHHQAAHGRKAA